MPHTMKAIVAKPGSAALDDDAFSEHILPIPEPGDRDLLVRVMAIGMNPVDTKVRRRMQKDTVLGWDACGIVEKTGAEVTAFNQGDALYYAGDVTRPGCNSQYHLVDERLAAHAPHTLSPQDSAALPLTAITAWEGLFERLGYDASENGNGGATVLIIGGAGGVGSMAIQLARWAGLRVFATASRPETRASCTKLGAHLILDHSNNLHEELKAAGAESVDSIFCTTQMERHWQAMVECIRPFGRIVLIDDPAESPDIRPLKFKCATISWEFMFARSMYATPDMAEQGRILAAVAQLVDNGVIVSTRQETVHGLTPENIRAMHIRQESGTTIGKQVLLV
jgi:NADPH2:quinone reductase